MGAHAEVESNQKLEERIDARIAAGKLGQIRCSDHAAERAAARYRFYGHPWDSKRYLIAQVQAAVKAGRVSRDRPARVRRPGRTYTPEPRIRWAWDETGRRVFCLLALTPRIWVIKTCLGRR